MIIKNNIIPFKGYKAFNLFGIIFTKEDLNSVDRNHEDIHSAQILEFVITFHILVSLIFGVQWAWLALPSYYIWYVLEYLIIRLLRLKDTQNNCYRSISFEREAYTNQNNLEYLYFNRKPFAWIKYLKVK